MEIFCAFGSYDNNVKKFENMIVIDVTEVIHRRPKAIVRVCDFALALRLHAGSYCCDALHSLLEVSSLFFRPNLYAQVRHKLESRQGLRCVSDAFSPHFDSHKQQNGIKDCDQKQR